MRKTNYGHHHPIIDDVSKIYGLQNVFSSPASLPSSNTSHFAFNQRSTFDVVSVGASVGLHVVEQVGAASGEPTLRSGALVKVRRRTLEGILEIAVASRRAFEWTADPRLAPLTAPVVFAVAKISLGPRRSVVAYSSILARSVVARIARGLRGHGGPELARSAHEAGEASALVLEALTAVLAGRMAGGNVDFAVFATEG